MADNKSKNEKESLRETIQLEREALREKIRELIDSEYAELEAEAERIAPGFDYAAEAEALKAEEAEELARASFAWDEEPAPDEEADALKALDNCCCVSLGKRILRTETAGMAALAMILYEIEL